MKRTDIGRRKRKGGFTLVELIVVLVMMAVLASVAVPTYLGYVDDNKAKECAKNREMLAAYANEMRVTDSSAGMNEAVMAHPEISCPSGGTYQVNDKNNTVYCDHEGHEGETTVILKNNSTVTADVDKVQTEAPTEAPSEADPPTPPTPPGKTPVSISLADCSVYVGDTCTMAATETSDIACTYSWSITPETTATINSSNGVVTGVSAGEAGTATARVTCIATPVDTSKYEGDSATATVTVVEKPSLSIAITSNADTINTGDTLTLTAVPTEVNCKVRGDSYNWQLSDSDGLQIKSGWNSPTIQVEASKAKQYTVYCEAKATPNTGGGEISSNQATTLVTVEERAIENGSLLGNLPEPFLINGGTGGINVTEYEMVKPGQWYSSDPNILSCPNDTHNKWLTAHQAGEIDLTYKTSGGQSQTVHARVVYPHNFLNVNGQPNAGVLAYNGEVLTLTAEYGLEGSDKRSTDRPVQWVNLSENKDIISISTEGENNEIAKITANDIGTAKVMARLQNEYTKKWTEVPVEYTIYNRITGVSVEPISLELIEGEAGEITIGYVPIGNLDTSGVSRHYGVSPNVGLDVEKMRNEGNSEVLKVTGNTPGTYTFEVYAVKGDSTIGSKKTCTVVVKPDPKKLTGVYVDPDSIEIMEGSTAQIQMLPVPDTASLDGVEFFYSEYDSNRIAIDSQGMITAKSAGEPTKIKISAHLGDQWFADNYLTVKVIPNPDKLVGISVEPSSINIYQGSEISITAGADSNGDVKLVQDPPQANFDGMTYDYLNESYNNVVTVSNGVVKASESESGSAKIRITVKTNYGDVKGYLTVNVKKTAVSIAGNTFSITPWENLKTHIDNNTLKELSRSNIYAAVVGDSEKYYLLSPVADLSGISTERISSFEDFLRANENQFIEINKNQVFYENSDYYWAGKGSILSKGGECYVCVEQPTGDNQNYLDNIAGWSNDFINKYFVKIS